MRDHWGGVVLPPPALSSRKISGIYPGDRQVHHKSSPWYVHQMAVPPSQHVLPVERHQCRTGAFSDQCCRDIAEEPQEYQLGLCSGIASVARAWLGFIFGFCAAFVSSMLIALWILIYPVNKM